MKIFDTNSGWLDRVNFVDINNVAVGYDMSSQCCEDYGWSISLKKPTDNINDDNYSDEKELEPYVFDTDFKEDIGYGYEGCGAIFKLVAEGKPDLFLLLYNEHNGYYSHGFDVKHGDKEVDGGSL